MAISSSSSSRSVINQPVLLLPPLKKGSRREIHTQQTYLKVCLFVMYISRFFFLSLTCFFLSLPLPLALSLSSPPSSSHTYVLYVRRNEKKKKRGGKEEKKGVRSLARSLSLSLSLSLGPLQIQSHRHQCEESKKTNRSHSIDCEPTEGKARMSKRKEAAVSIHYSTQGQDCMYVCMYLRAKLNPIRSPRRMHM